MSSLPNSVVIVIRPLVRAIDHLFYFRAAEIGHSPDQDRVSSEPIA
jgi:hypothetical protein